MVSFVKKKFKNLKFRWHAFRLNNVELKIAWRITKKFFFVCMWGVVKAISGLFANSSYIFPKDIIYWLTVYAYMIWEFIELSITRHFYLFWKHIHWKNFRLNQVRYNYIILLLLIVILYYGSFLF